MRKNLPVKMEKRRVMTGYMASTRKDGIMGAFIVRGPCATNLKIISSGTWPDEEWEHVSVSTERRCPNWIEMCWVKDMFWNKDETVVQFHPGHDYINFHPYCLHLWKHRNGHTLPDSKLVGPNGTTIPSSNHGG